MSEFPQRSTTCIAWLTLAFALHFGAVFGQDNKTKAQIQVQNDVPFAIVLGTAQDGGYPQAGCEKSCCTEVWQDASLRRYVSCVAIVDPISRQRWLLDCTPDFRDQLKLLYQFVDFSGSKRNPPLDGIFLTHAHVGHYAGLFQLGREVIGADGVTVYGMPRMQTFLQTNGPWSQLVDLQQIEIRRMAAATPVVLNERIRVIPFEVPHRDEFSETVGFRVECNGRTLIYLPDIDKWQRWSVKIENLVSTCDIAFLDGTFFDLTELPGRDLEEIPHPTVRESMERFARLDIADRKKIHFIHMNHSNDLLRSGSDAQSDLTKAGMQVAEQGMLWKFDP